MKRIDMAIELDDELRLTRRQSWDTQNFEAIQVKFRGYMEGPNTIFPRSQKWISLKVSFDQIETRFPQVEGVKPEARGGQERAKEDQIRAI